MLKYVVCLCKGCDGCCVFSLYSEARSCRCSCIGSVSVSSCRCSMLVSWVQPVAVLNAAFCMTQFINAGQDGRRIPQSRSHDRHLKHISPLGLAFSKRGFTVTFI